MSFIKDIVSYKFFKINLRGNKRAELFKLNKCVISSSVKKAFKINKFETFSPNTDWRPLSWYIKIKDNRLPISLYENRGCSLFFVLEYPIYIWSWNFRIARTTSICNELVTSSKDLFNRAQSQAEIDDVLERTLSKCFGSPFEVFQKSSNNLLNNNLLILYIYHFYIFVEYVFRLLFFCFLIFFKKYIYKIQIKTAKQLKS